MRKSVSCRGGRSGDATVLLNMHRALSQKETAVSGVRPALDPKLVVHRSVSPGLERHFSVKQL